MYQRRIRSRAEQLAGYRRVLEARSPATPADRLRDLAADELRPVRLWVARNPRCPSDALDALARDEDRTVQWNVLLNAGTPAPALWFLADLEKQEAERSSHPWFIVRSKVLAHPNAGWKLKWELLRLGVRPSGPFSR